ncbi:MAG: LPS-assembly protein LptD [Treponema sp.]|nr:LPS-assembly protein LptD [Treponema sp.]
MKGTRCHKLLYKFLARKRYDRVSCLILFFILSFFTPLYAQEEDVNDNDEIEIQEIEIQEAEEAVPESRLSSSQSRRIEMEINTSTLGELAVWCRTLGLSESGTRADLSRRIREHFEMPEPAAKDEDRKIITIESAQTTEYFTIDVIDEDYARLKGDVRISLKDGDSEHRIRANEILFNRTRNILTARGQVVYEKIETDKTETFRGENITVNIDDWSSIFLEGSTQHELDSDGTAYLFSGAVISRSDQDVTILSNARVTSATNEEALWSINATKLWLLPSSDFSIFNAVLKVGEIPVLYLPFFYFPGDELVFHPVIGFRSREGAFVQTTTYILGRPKTDPADANSITKILGNTDDMERELHGLFLRSTGKRAVNKNETSLKVLADYYVNLGTYLGLDLNTPKAGAFNQSEFSIGVGFTRTISMVGGNYTPYAPNNYDGTFDWNHSNFFSTEVPFRYRMRLQSSIGGRYGNLAWNLPYYSDPYVNMDFLNRAENMDFMNMLQQGITVEETATQNLIGTYQWHVNGNLNPSFPSLAPYISRVSISNISTTMTFTTKRNMFVDKDSPGRDFYVPDKYTIYNISGSVSGTPLSLGRTPARPNTAAPGTIAERDDPLGGIGMPLSPWADTSSDSEEEESQSSIDSRLITPPVISQNFNLPAAGNNRFSIDYQVSPTSSSELQFLTSRWERSDQVDWSDVRTVLGSFGGNSNINLRMDHSTGLYSNAVTFSGSGTYRDFSFMNEDAITKTDMDTARRQQYSQTNYSSSYAYNGTVRPLYANPVFGQSNMQYSFRGTMVRSKRYEGGDGPELTPQWGSWVKEKLGENIYGLNSHQVAGNIAANVMNTRQNLTVSAALPPLDGLISTNATFRFWISETNINFRVEKPETSDDWIWRPVNFTETLRFQGVGSFSYHMVINPEENNEITTIRTTLTLWNFSAMFSATKIARSIFVPDNPNEPFSGRWELQGEPSLNPRELRFSYNRSIPNIDIIKNRLNLTFNLNTSLNFDLQQHTNTNFQLSSGFTTNVIGFVRFRLDAVTQNAVIWRYFKNVPGMEAFTFMYREGPQNNIFTDLIDSFNFFDESKRRRTGFKMHRFELSAIHFLGDWTAELQVNLYPYLNQRLNPMKYEITTDVSFLVKWIPISEIKSHVNYHGRHERWEIQ